MTNKQWKDYISDIAIGARKTARIKKETKKTKFTLEQAKELGTEMGINWDKCKFEPKDLLQGMFVELEHGTVNSITNITDDDPMMTAKISAAHLMERGKEYYPLLIKYVEGKND